MTPATPKQFKGEDKKKTGNLLLNQGKKNTWPVGLGAYQRKQKTETSPGSEEKKKTGRKRGGHGHNGGERRYCWRPEQSK